MELSDFKINNKGTNYSKEFYETLEAKIERFNFIMEKKGEVNPEKYKWVKILEYAMNNEVCIYNLNHALTIYSSDMETAMERLKA